MRKALSVLVFLSFTLFDCLATVPPRAENIPSECRAACTQLKGLGCRAGLRENCYDMCVDLETQHRLLLNPVCISQAQTCEMADECAKE